MKLKVSPKDLVVFGVFCVFLLYFSAIAVLNVLNLINNGEFYGFLPFEAFSGKYILITLFLFVSIVVAIFLSVSSSIFERQNGVGFTLSEKEEKGYSRWLKEKEMKKAFNIYRVGVKDETATAGGTVFINDGKNMWVDNGENHTLVIGVTGSGKTTAVVDPLIYSLCKHGESMVITDPKGEIYKNHAELLKARGYKIIVLNFRQPNMGNAWNPLTIPYMLYKNGNVDKAVELVDDVALNILQDKKAQDPFWEKSASDYFSGCALGLLEDAKEEEINLNSISLMTTVGEEKFGAGSNYIKEYFLLKGEQSSPYIFASNTINSPNETKGGILAVFRQKIRLFASREQLSEMLAYSDFNMRDIGQEKTAVFMVIHDEKTTYHALATIFIKQCYETLIDVAQSNGGKLPVRTNFILDEFANMPPLKDVTTMVTAARSRAIRFTFIIQNFAQLNEVYGQHDAETIRSNCGNLMYLLTTELAALEEISKLCGEVKSKKDDKTASQPLVTVSDLQKLQMNEVIILRNRMNPFRTKLKQGFDTDWGDSEFGKAEFIERPKKEIQLFDVKEHVRLRKKSKMMDGLDSKGAPSLGGGDFNPFGGANPFGGVGNGPKIPTFEEFMAARNGNNPNAKENNKPTTPSFDVDDLVKRIDAKIAELEAQEKAEEEAKKSGIIPPITNQEKIDIPINKEPTMAEKIQQELSSVSNNPFEMKTDVIKPDIVKDNFNPFDDNQKEIHESKFIDKDVIQSIPDPIQTSPIQAPIFDTPKIEDKNINSVPGEINTFKDLFNQTGTQVNDQPQKNNTVGDAVKDINNKPFDIPTINTINDNSKQESSPKMDNQPKVNVDNQSKVISDVSDDAFFDDFFDED